MAKTSVAWGLRVENRRFCGHRSIGIRIGCFVFFRPRERGGKLSGLLKIDVLAATVAWGLGSDFSCFLRPWEHGGKVLCVAENAEISYE